ncbi:mini-chromosome maintenance complex-binding protein-like isoform X1 [Centruroides sculpturatus]|uniref:mini-chromosome maintenance complex-binding protein-like isoform X1 n=1 Tax=Centruroides sculpturatus TaxID=218467 RepID=UPI000C6D15E1|nr:mini-chromosome maintenance complex-binding protein-like isoform X1 [Centruroides sculpturatus]
MPGVDDWINNPLEIVQKIFEEEKNDCHNTVVKYFARFLDREDSNKFIPSLNDVSLKHLKPNTLVRFRCMIQDMFDPEFYFNTYEVKNISTGQNILRCGLYKDLLSCEQTEEIIVQSPRNINSERLTYHCISVPGENAWVKDGFCHYSKLTSPNDTSACKEIVEEMDEFEIQVKRKRLDTDRTGNITEELPSSAANGLSDSNIPHLENDEIACIIKLYDTAENFKVTEVIECIGILDTSESKSNFNEMDEDIEMSSQVQSVSSLPKIHAIRIKPFLHNNPYLPINVNLENRLAMEIFSQARRLRHDLVRCFTHILLGDKLSAEYLLFNLISSVYYQQNITTLGKFCLNLMNIPTSNGYVKKLFSLLQKLTTKLGNNCNIHLTSPDLASSDFYLFPTLKKKLQAKCFQSDSYVQNKVWHILCALDMIFEGDLRYWNTYRDVGMHKVVMLKVEDR